MRNQAFILDWFFNLDIFCFLFRPEEALTQKSAYSFKSVKEPHEKYIL